MKQKTTQTTNNIVPTNQQKQPPTIFTYKTKTKKTTNETTFNNGCLGSGIDEERSKPR